VLRRGSAGVHEQQHDVLSQLILSNVAQLYPEITLEQADNIKGHSRSSQMVPFAKPHHILLVV